MLKQFKKMLIDIMHKRMQLDKFILYHIDIRNYYTLV